MNQLPVPEKDYKVLVRCFTFNHSKYIEDALNGFVMQQTNFPFVCFIVDDASTDGEQEIIKSFLNKECDMDKSQTYNTESAIITIAPHRTNLQCTLAVYFLKENHYSIKRPKKPYVDPWRDCCQYEAICEGDDYWIDNQKLQKQVSYMECHLDCMMTCTRTKYFSLKKDKFVYEQYCRKGDGVLSIKDVIYRQGLYISTCSIMIKSSLLSDYPIYCKNAGIGDYPLQIYAALQGNIFYFDDVMVVYRMDNSESWMGKQAIIRGTIDEKRLKVMDNTIFMLSSFSKDYPIYNELFNNKICEFINRGVPYRKRSSRSDVILYIEHYKSFINQYNLFWKLDLLIRRCRVPGFRSFYTKFFTKRFFEKRKAICFV